MRMIFQIGKKTVHVGIELSSMKLEPWAYTDIASSVWNTNGAVNSKQLVI